LLCSAAVRAPHGDAPEQRRNGGSHNRGIEPDGAEEHPSEHKTATRHGNPRDQDQLATALNLGSEAFDELLKAHDLVMWVAALVIMQVQYSQRISARLDFEVLPRTVIERRSSDLANYPTRRWLWAHKLKRGPRDCGSGQKANARTSVCRALRVPRVTFPVGITAFAELLTIDTYIDDIR
jgi:hypothetical protein